MDFVQDKYFDRFQALYAGQLADWASASKSQHVRAYVREELVAFGQGVVKGAVQDFLGLDHVTTPYAVKKPVPSGSPSVEADFVGIVVHNLGGTDDGTGKVYPGLKTKGICTIAERYSGVIIGVNIPAGRTIAHGAAVYLVLADGSFHDASAAGRILIPDLIWYGTNVGPSAVTGVAPKVGRIQMTSRGPQGPAGA